MKEKEYCFKLAMEVRDYELDTEAIVNNANYLHYMEHTRHKFCQHAGVSFMELQKMGIIAVVRKIEIEYIESLRSGETFVSCLNLEREGPRFIFHQDILKPDGTVVTSAVITCVMLRDGKLSRGNEVAELFKDYI
ncbi:MAG: acyl-CoA thioesterase [Muribaculaceae bacterium]|nr:acyl-CoA thioesterase [Muribaculaceae bacterium]